MPPWLQVLGEPTAQRLLAWGQAQADACLADVFGYHAVQAGWPGFDALRSNRMPHRWRAQQEFDEAAPPPDVSFDSRAWPWAAESLDLVVLPHTLERSADPHACLREVERVLIPEGQVLITGGYNTSTGTLTSTESFVLNTASPASSTWTNTGNKELVLARAMHSGTLLSNGFVLVVGTYYTTSGTTSNTCEIWSP